MLSLQSQTGRKAQSSLIKLAQDLQKKNETKEGIVTERVAHAVDQILDSDVLTSLYSIQQFFYFGKQGTSQNEAVHSYLSSLKSSYTARQSYESLQLQLSVLFYFFNQRYD